MQDPRRMMPAVLDRHIEREDQDAFSLLSQQRTAAAQAQGLFADEIAPITVTMGVADKVGDWIKGQG